MKTDEASNMTYAGKSQSTIEVQEKADKIIAKSTAKVSTLAALPVPFLDVAGTAIVQNQMIGQLEELYGIQTNDGSRTIVVTIVTSGIAKLMSEALESLSVSTGLEKLISSSLIKASVSGIITQAIGEIYQEHLVHGKIPATIDIDNFIAYLQNLWASDALTVQSLSSKAIESITTKYSA